MLRADLFGKVNNAQQAVMEVRTVNESLREELRETKKRLAEANEAITRYRDWSEERACYTKMALGPDAFVYVKTEHLEAESAESSKPVPHLCADCYGRAEYSILQTTRTEGYRRELTCPRCKNRVVYSTGSQVRALGRPLGKL